MNKVTAKCSLKKSVSPPQNQHCIHRDKSFEDQHCSQCGKHFEGFFARVDHQCLPHVCRKCNHSFATDSELMIHAMHCGKPAAITKLHPKKICASDSGDNTSSSQSSQPKKIPKGKKNIKPICHSLNDANLSVPSDSSKKGKDTKVNIKHAESQRRKLKTMDASDPEKKSKKICTPSTASTKLCAANKSVTNLNSNLRKKRSSKRNSASEHSSGEDSDTVTSNSLQSVLEIRNAQKQSYIRCLRNESNPQELSHSAVNKGSRNALNEHKSSILIKSPDMNRSKTSFYSKGSIHDKLAKYRQLSLSKLEKIQNKTVVIKSSLGSEQSVKVSDIVNKTQKSRSANFIEHLKQLTAYSDNEPKISSKISDEVSGSIWLPVAKRNNFLTTNVTKHVNAQKRTFGNSGEFNEKEHHSVRRKYLLPFTKGKEFERTKASNSNYTKSNTSKNSTLFCNENNHLSLDYSEPQHKFEEIVNSLPLQCAVLLKAPAEEFKCAKCHKVFKNFKGASSHYVDCKSVIKNVLSIEKDVIWVCTICHKSIVSVSKISDHIKSCQNITENSTLCKKHCQICGQTFFSMVLFEKHACIQKSLLTCRVLLPKISIGVSNDLPAYKCTFCSEEFSSELNLRTHTNHCSHQATNHCSFQTTNPEQDFASTGQTRIHIKTENLSPESSSSLASVPFCKGASSYPLDIHSKEIFFQHRDSERHIEPEMVSINSDFISTTDVSRDSEGNSISLHDTALESELSDIPSQRASCLSSSSGASISESNGINAVNNFPNNSENAENVLEMLFSTDNVCTCQHKTPDKVESKPCLLCLNDVNKVRNVYRKISKNPAAILNLPTPTRLLNGNKVPKKFSTLELSATLSKRKATSTHQNPQAPSKSGTGYPTPPVSPNGSIVANAKNPQDSTAKNVKNTKDSTLNILDVLPEDVFIDIFAITKAGTKDYIKYICAVCVTFTTPKHEDIVKHHLEIHKKVGKLNVVPIPEVDEPGGDEEYLKELGVEF